jgi:hypothetical protein
VIANVALDYTEWAPPLNEAAIRHDIDSYEAQFDRTPTKIIMWVHQWEYLAKKYKKYVEQPQYVATDVKVDLVGIYVTARAAESSDGGTIWGIRVEVRDPEAHKP